MNEVRENLDFGQAVGFLKDGFVATNDDWNGNGMELTLELVAILLDGGETIGAQNDEFVLKTPSGKKAIGWRPSKMDILSTKWRIIGEPD